MILDKTQLRALSSEELKSYLADLLMIPPLGIEVVNDVELDCESLLQQYRRLVAYSIYLRTRLEKQGFPVTPTDVLLEEQKVEVELSLDRGRQHEMFVFIEQNTNKPVVPEP